MQAMPCAYCSAAVKTVNPSLLSIHIGTTGLVVVKENLKKQKAPVDICPQTSDRPIVP